MPNDPTDPTIKAFLDAGNAEITKLKSRRLGIQSLVTATAAGDTTTQTADLAGLAPLVAADAGSFYANFAKAHVTAVNAEVAKAISQATDPMLGPIMSRLAQDAATEIAAIITRRATIQMVRDGTLNGATDTVNAALASLQTVSRADANPFYVQLPTLQANAAAIVAAPADPVVNAAPAVPPPVVTT